MITRRHQLGSTQSVAIYSDCERYRYSLTREWDETGRKVLFIMLNPSTASELRNDPTVERCERRARALGFGAFGVVNIFAWRATDPKVLKAASEPVGALNDRIVTDACKWADQIIAAWGAHGAHLDRGMEMQALLETTNRQLFHLGLTKHGHPRHPLYVSYQQSPTAWMAVDSR